MFPQPLQFQPFPVAAITRPMGRPPRIEGIFPNRVRELRLERGFSLEALGAMIGLSASSVQRIETGESQLRQVHVDALVKALRVDPSDLFQSGRRDRVPIVGWVGAGAEVLLYDPKDTKFPIRHVDCPRHMEPGQTSAVEVHTDALMPIQENWLLFYSTTAIHPSELIGVLSVVKLAEDDRIYVKQIRRGYTKGRFILTAPMAAPIEDVKIEWAAAIEAMLPMMGAVAA